jgi:ABC-type multidrug transport system ATPase subunit
VDAVSRKEFWEMLMRLKGHDITILVSTPYMDEAELCDRVALIQNGHLLSVDRPENVIGNYSSKLLAISAADMYRLKKDLEMTEHAGSVHLFGQQLHLSSEKDVREELSAYLGKMGHRDLIIETVSPNIEDCFLDLMARD